MCNIEGCNNNLIVNKKYNLCEFHNKQRLIAECTKVKQEIIKSTKQYQLKRSSLKPISKNNLIKLKKKKETYDLIDQNRDQVCEGCMNSNFLSRSHVISVNNRKDLEDDPRNIHLFCMERIDGSKGCAKRAEGTLEERQSLLTFEEDMNYIKEKDIKLYNLIILKNES